MIPVLRAARPAHHFMAEYRDLDDVGQGLGKSGTDAGEYGGLYAWPSYK